MRTNRPFKMTMDDGSSTVFPHGNAVLVCSITHGTATKWVSMTVLKLRQHVKAEDGANGPCLIPPGHDLRHSIRSIEPVEKT